MKEMILQELSRMWEGLARGFAHLVPRLIVMLVVIGAGWLAAYIVRAVVRGILRISRFERLSENAGTARLLHKAALPSSTELLSAFAFWMTWLGFILLGISTLGIGIQEHISNLLFYLPRVLVALLIILFGLAAAGFFSRAALLAAVNSNWPSPRLISGAVRFAMVVLAAAMAFEQLGLARETIIAAFSILFGALMLGLAIAFGLGGQHLARRMLERRFSHPQERDREDELSPL